MDGNIQAVLDEYVHVLIDSLGLGGLSIEDAAEELGATIESALTIRTTSQEFREIKVDADGQINLQSQRIRCRYALRFGQAKDEDDRITREDQVRTAFNSPFRPFILATTSIGQEGLDFHLYCHSIYHWNLPSNPVDLEQREGRVHRYKGHVIRKNLGEKVRPARPGG